MESHIGAPGLGLTTRSKRYWNTLVFIANKLKTITLLSSLVLVCQFEKNSSVSPFNCIHDQIFANEKSTIKTINIDRVYNIIKF